MHPGALQALEFDQIVEAVRSLALTPLGAARLSGLGRTPTPGEWRRCSRPRPRGCATSLTTGRFRCRRPPISKPSCRRWPSRGAPLEPLRLLGLADFLESVEQTRAAVRRAAGQLPLLHALDGGVVLVQGRDRRGAGEDRSVRRGASTRRARSCGRFATGCASSAPGCAARWSRSCAERKPPSTSRSRSSPIATAATCSSSGRSIAPRSRASSTAARRAARACSSSRSARSRSTTRSSRSRSRKPRRSGGSCSR